MAYATLRVARTGRVLLVRIDNPPRNLLTMEVVDDLARLVRAVDADASVRAVVLTGEPHEEFAAHFDVGVIEAMAGRVPVHVPPAAAPAVLALIDGLGRVPGAGALLDRTPAAGARALLRMHRLFLRMGRSDTVFVAAVNGLALGGGCELALACDLRYMATTDTCRIGLPEGLLGIIPGGGGTQRLTRLVGPGRALQMMLEGTALDAAQALDLGLVHAQAPADELLGTALAAARTASRRSPWTVRMLKRSVYHGGSRSLGSGLAEERVGLVVTSTSAQGRQGMQRLLAMFPSGAAVPPGAVLHALATADVDLGGPVVAGAGRAGGGGAA
ncbi:enoyl-CoA hydratase/isomerase family protein [Georgenia satyanarayanai]|uniref:enoyl-CoA hydratase/isomerase family protein n=1 Tax=Georgenia satyanarayanai TaxID=860221 RepID=UPI00186B4F87|nr:enoyl-CoA hydratase/isomerase family protein [Georgenia satyanarayanai]